MKLLVLPLSALLVALPVSAQQPQAAPAAPTPAATSAPPPPNTLVDGTPIKLRLAENLSSEVNKTGDEVPFEVTEEVDVMGVPVIAKGATALGSITNAEPKRRMGRGGKLDVVLTSVRLVDNEKVQISATRDAKGGGHIGIMTTAMVATAVVFFPAAPLFLFMHGKSIEIPKGTEITAYVQGDMHLDMAKMVPPGTLAPGAPAAPALASLSIDASVPGADIEIDGKFVGNTPSTLSVAAGDHTIVVRKKGFADWTRQMNVAGASIHLTADLEAATTTQQPAPGAP